MVRGRRTPALPARPRRGRGRRQGRLLHGLAHRAPLPRGVLPLHGARDVPGRSQPAHQGHSARLRRHASAPGDQPPGPHRRARRHAGPPVQRPRRVRHRRRLLGGRAGRVQHRPGRQARAMGGGPRGRDPLHGRGTVQWLQGRARRDAGPQRDPQAAAEAAPAGLGGLHPSVVGADGRPEGHRRTEFRLHRPRPAQGARRRLLQGVRGAGHADHPGDQSQPAGHRRRPVDDGRTQRRRGTQAARHRRRLLLVRDHALLHDRHAHAGPHQGVGALRGSGQGGSDAGLRPGPRRHRWTRDGAGVPARLRGERRRRDHPAAQPAQPRGHDGVHRDHGQGDPARVHRARRKGRRGKGQAPRTGDREGRGAPPGLGRTAVRRDLLVRRPAHRPRRQVHCRRDSRGDGRDQRGPGPGRPVGEGTAGEAAREAAS